MIELEICAALALSWAPSQDLTAMAEESLRARLAMPAAGRFALESEFQAVGVTEEERLQAFFHVRELFQEAGFAETWERVPELEPGAGASPIRGIAGMPPVIVMLPGAERSNSRFERFDSSWPDFRYASADATTEGFLVQRFGERRDGEFISWYVHRGERSDVLRRAAPTSQHALVYCSGPSILYAALAQYRILLEAEEHHLSRSGDASTLELAVDVRDRDLARSLRDCGAHYGLCRLPLAIELSYRTTPTQDVLEVRWNDRLGDWLAWEQLVWTEADSLPAIFRSESYVPGTGEPCEVARISTARLEPETGGLLAGGWTPLGGQTVQDYRFDAPLRYEVGSDGSLPEDGELSAASGRETILQATRALLRGGSGGPSLRATTDPLPGASSRTLALRGGRQLLEVVPATFDLGPVPFGTIHEFQFTLSNTGAEAVELGPLQASCGCTNTSLSATRIEPGESALLRGRQEVQQLGPAEHAIRILVLGAADATLDLAVTLEGTGGVRVLNDVSHLGTLPRGAGCPGGRRRSGRGRRRCPRG